ncbi:hypothetical protein ACPPTR_08985 [Ralstonia pseudosolanacearum]|uniref:hypothetical protein n=1 Tax=Ralstonia pseudosolanacearum TaxID=1310165 RepID=UPI001E3F6199|nr:hypothetical protein [Ralstonia pseudosolanacearum]MCD9228624.1 hypothetical protein [Ralstonia pseudosolanacearum]
MKNPIKKGDRAEVIGIGDGEFPIGTIVEAVAVEPPTYDGDLPALFKAVDGRRIKCGSPGAWLYKSDVKLLSTASAFDLLSAMTGKPLKFRSGCAVRFVALVPEAKPHCQLVLLNPATGNVVTRYANGKGSEEPYDEPGDILLA